MKVLYVNPQSRRNLERYDALLLNHISRGELQFNLTYVCAKAQDSEICDAVSLSKIFDYERYANKILRGFRYLINLTGLLIIVSKLNPNIIHIQWHRLLPFDILFILIFKYLFKIKLVFTAHNIVSHWSGKSFGFLEQFYLRQFNIVLVHEQSGADLLRRSLTGCPYVKIAPHGLIDQGTKGFNPYKTTINSFYQNYDIKLLFIGAARPSKGLERLIHALDIFESSGSDFTIGLLVLGPQENVKRPRFDHNSIHNVLVIDDLVDDACMTYAISNCDFGVLPYHNISQSGALLTFLAAESSVIVSNVGGLGEAARLFPEVVHGFDSDDDLLKLLKMAVSLGNRMQDKKDVWMRVRREYSWQKSSEIHASIYSGLRTW